MTQKKPNLCYQGWSAEDGNSKGRCCCNCKWQRPITGHPWNKGDMKGSVAEIKGWGCTVPELPNITFLDREHSMCELHDWKELA